MYLSTGTSMLVSRCAGISLDRFQRDKAKPYGATRKRNINMKEVREILEKNRVLKLGTLALCEDMAALGNNYAHGHGLKPRDDALKALEWMHSFIDNETNLMRDYVIVDGMLTRKHADGQTGHPL
jgi:hypothetical protein